MRHFRQSYAAARDPEAMAAYAKDLGMSKYCRKPTEQFAVQVNEPFTVEIEGVKAKGKPGDYLVIGPAGDQYPVDREVFERTYEPVRPFDPAKGAVGARILWERSP